MKQQTIKVPVTIPVGFEAVELDKSANEIVCKEILKPVMERIKTLDDVFNENNITGEEIENMFDNLSDHFMYQFIAELICETLNEGWQPDWSNSNEEKCFLWFKMSDSSSASGFSFDVCGSWYS
ncbi:MAG: hypothetical protein JXR60_06035 [Bacteroidales bacterium]|nr:hypothetical protein [Bacteroidales bacterium]